MSNYKDQLLDALSNDGWEQVEVIDLGEWWADDCWRMRSVKMAWGMPLYLTFLVDPMWGNGAGWFSELLGGGTTSVVEIHNQRNPIFPEMTRPEPIPPNVDAGLKATTDNKADVLIVTDGDADRLGLGDENGGFIDQLRVFGLLAYYFLEVRGDRGTIVKTLSTTDMLTKLGKIYDVPVIETGVGFKFVAPAMLEHKAMIGGEESGGYAFGDHVPERDGILAGLYILDLTLKVSSFKQ